MLLPVVLSLLFLLPFEINGHGYMLEPPNRSSLYRFFSDATPNYDDNQLFCGGAYVQWDLNGGKCGLCGDTYEEPHPQPNENTGTYGQGRIVRTYSSGAVIDVNVVLTKNHLGNFQFSLCEIQDDSLPESGEECFQALTLAGGALKREIKSEEIDVDIQVQLPAGKTCEHCVLRWQYTAGNNWGECEDGTSALGCGPQETFRNCADIAIV